MAVSTKLELEYSQFKRGMAEAQASVKTMDAELKKSEATFRETGDAEKYMSEQADLLKQKLNAQKEVARNAEQMFLNLGKRGIAPTSVEYQRMAQRMLNAQAAVSTTQAELNKLNNSQTDAAASAKTLGQEVSGIGKNVSLQNITDGLGRLTDGMEKAYRTAVRVGRAVVRSAMDATGWADDVMTRAVKYGVDAETIQKLDQVAAYIDTDVDTMISAKDRLSKNRETVAELLGISSDGKSVDEVFWEAGEAIKNLGEGFDQNEIAMKIFGKGWRDLLPLFTAGREQYEALMENQNVLSNEQVESIQKADDAFQSIQNEVENLKRTFWAEHSGTVIELLQWVVDNKESVIAALTAIGGAFAALKLAEVALNITKIVSGFKELNLFGGAGAAATAGAAAGAPGNTATYLMQSGGAAKGIADFLTSGKGITAVGSLLLTPIITKAMRGDYTRDPLEGMDPTLRSTWEKMNSTNVPIGGGGNLRDMWNKAFGNKPAEVPVEPKAEADAAVELAAQIGTVTVPVNLRMQLGGGVLSGAGLTEYMKVLATGGLPRFANGIPYVPSKRLAWLDPGERVLTARENRNYTFNNNTYFGGVNLHNGMEVDALTDSIAKRQARQQAAYGV